MVGTTLRHYRILEKLGEGGMGEVYKARDAHLGRLVAVKVLHPGQPCTPAQRQRFVNEARAASALNHPNIVHIYDIGNDAGFDFIVMEYVSGLTLNEILRRKGMTLSKSLACAIQAADALTRAHAAGLVHRDLKPSNIMVNDEGVVKLLDFGLAKLVERSGASDNLPTVTGEALMPTREGMIVGTAAYMAPEQAEGKPIDARADIFSFGALLYEMASGRRAFPGDSPASMLVAVMTRDPPSLDRIPRQLDRIIWRCLRKNPAERWHSMADVKLALEDARQDLSTHSAHLTRVQLPRQRLGLAAGLGLLAALLAAALLLGDRWFRREEAVPDLVPRALTTFPGRERNPTISPDGTQVAFTWDGPRQDQFDIYVQHIDSAFQTQRTNDPAEDDHPAWSPDGRWIAFHKHFANHRAALCLMAPLGGPVKKVLEGDLGSGLSWSPDGKWLLTSFRESEQDRRGLFLLSGDSGERRRLTSPPPEASGDSDGVISPDGRALVFLRGRADFVNDLLVLPLNKDLRPAGEPRKIGAPPHWYAHSPVFTAGGQSIVFSGGPLGNHSLWQADAARARPLRRLAFAGDVTVADLTISRPNRNLAPRMIYSRAIDDANIWSTSLRDVSKPPELLVSSTRDDMRPRYSPDGSQITFESSRRGSINVWVSNADGSNPVALTATSAYSGSPNWSPDGRYIAYHSNEGGSWNIHVVDPSGENPRQLTRGSEMDNVPFWSRDGEWIYFARRGDGPFQIWRMPSRGGAPIQVTQAGGYMGMESPDGRFLIYAKDGGNPTALWRLAFATGEETRIAALLNRDSFCVTRLGLYWIGDRELRTLRFLRWGDRESTLLRKFDRSAAPGLAVSPDGAHLLFSQYDQSGSDLMLVDNFR
ncbi:MAG: PD40 domain-containing protein [Bryobacteraceae bacterium]|nr:PD40 domain-containing protein [Bryobacteraceae bacterium]